jgi:hypothetical protein
MRNEDDHGSSTTRYSVYAGERCGIALEVRTCGVAHAAAGHGFDAFVRQLAQHVSQLLNDSFRV